MTKQEHTKKYKICETLFTAFAFGRLEPRAVSKRWKPAAPVLRARRSVKFAVTTYTVWDFPSRGATRG
jgi:hypothetical protein